MGIQYKWHAEGENSCYACKRFDGEVFNSLEQVPNLPVHPNCKCFIEVLSGVDEHQLRIVADEVAEKKNEAAQIIKELKKKQKDAGQDYTFFTEIKELLDEFYGVAKTFEIFWRNYQHVKEANTLGADKYFHSKANAEAAQLGKVAEKTAHLISDAREVLDFYSNLIWKKLSWDATYEDMQADLKANAYGRKVGRENPDANVKDLVDIFRPPVLDKKY